MKTQNDRIRRVAPQVRTPATPEGAKAGQDNRTSGGADNGIRSGHFDALKINERRAALEVLDEYATDAAGTSNRCHR